MHEAYEAFQLLKLSVFIESIAAYDDILIVGTRQGHLLTYSVTQRSIDQKHEVQLLQYNKLFSKKPIQQLEVIPEYQLLVCLKDNIVSIHDLNLYSFTEVQLLEQSKGATLFTLNIKKNVSLTGETSTQVYLCVAVKRKLQLYYWKNKFLQLMDDITLNDIPKSIAWCEQTICVGFRGEYTLYPLDGTSKELFPTSSSRSSEPCITKISDTIFALGRDCQTVLVNDKGDAETNQVLKWTSPPTVMAWDDPYALGLLSESVEVHTVEPCGVVQSLTGLPKARLIVKCKQGVLYAASVTHVWCIKAVEIAKQRQVLLNLKQFKLALKLTSISNETEEDKKLKINQIQTIYANDLFLNKKFKESMEEFLKLDTDPYDVIRLFPDLLPQTESENVSTAAGKLQDKDLENGLLALIYYLTAARLQVQKKNGEATEGGGSSSSVSKSTAQLLQIIDTTLLKCYLQTNDALVAPLIRLNTVNLSEAEKTLKKSQKYNELIILYQTKKQHKKALDLLQKQADEPDSSLKGHERTVQYLQHLGSDHIQLIFDYAGWVLDAHPEDGLKIFTEDLEKVEHLPRPRVLDYLLRTHKSQVIPYLEHVIHVWMDKNSLFHNALIHEYREKVLESLKENASIAEKQAGQHNRKKLVEFLEKSVHYTAETVLGGFPYNNLYEERAIIFGKLGKHKEALSIYVQVLRDINRAIEYCKNVPEKSLKGIKQEDNVYVILISMLLSPTPENLVGAGVGVSGVIPQETVVPDIETALKLLDQYADKIPPVKALEALPNSVSLVSLRHFLETALRTKLSERRQTQVLKGLLYAEHLQVQELRMMYEKQNIILTELNICCVCKKRFANQSAFVRYPNGDIVHYSCQEKKN